MKESTPIAAPDTATLFEAMAAFHSGVTPVDSEIARLTAERRRLESTALRAFGAGIMYKVVVAEKIADMQGDHTIGVYEVAREGGRTFINPNVPDWESGPYIPPAVFIPPSRRRVIGRAVGVDLEHESIVLMPRLIPGERFWVRLVGPDGEPLVRLSIRDKK